MSDADKARDLLERALRESGYLDNGAPEHCLAMATIGTGFATLAVLEPVIMNEEVTQTGPGTIVIEPSNTDLTDAVRVMVMAAMERLADLAEQGSKHRTAEWLTACAQAYQEGQPFPPAPRYKGPLQDLDNLTADMLLKVRDAAQEEIAKRAQTATSKWTHPRGGADQWNGPVGG